MTTTTTTYLAIGAFSWGVGNSPDEAKRKCRRFAKRGERLSVYALPDGATNVRVDDLGSVRWGGTPGKLTHVAGPDRREVSR